MRLLLVMPAWAAWPPTVMAWAQGLDGEKVRAAAGAAGRSAAGTAGGAAHLGYGLGLLPYLAHDPAAARDQATGDVAGTPLDQLVVRDPPASLDLFDYFELALRLPVRADLDRRCRHRGGQRPQAAPGLGDVGVVPKVSFGWTAINRAASPSVCGAEPACRPAGARPCGAPVG